LVWGAVVVTGHLNISTTDGLLHYSAVASEPLESKSLAPAAEVAASSCLRRAATLAGFKPIYGDRNEFTYHTFLPGLPLPI